MVRIVLTDFRTGSLVHVNPRQVTFIMDWYVAGAKPEDKPIGALLGVPGHPTGLLVKESKDQCVRDITPYWEGE
jgi:hypothetical protein